MRKENVMYAHVQPKIAQMKSSSDRVRARRDQAAAAPGALDRVLNGSSQVRSQLEMQTALDQSPRAAAQAKLVQMMAGAGVTPYGRRPEGQGISDEEELIQYKAAVQRAGLMLRVVQRVVVTVRDSHADEAAEEMQYSTTQNLMTAKNQAVVDTLINLGNNPLAGLPADETLYVVGHGTGDTISGMGPGELLSHLEAFGLSNSFTGLIDLASCDSADFIAGFVEALQAKHYVNDVKGYGGLVHVNPQGGFEVLPSGVARWFFELKAQAKAAYDREKAALDEELLRTPSDSTALGKLAKLREDYNAIIAELNAMFEPAAKHEAFSSREAWKRHGTPTSLDEAIELGRL